MTFSTENRLDGQTGTCLPRIRWYNLILALYTLTLRATMHSVTDTGQTDRRTDGLHDDGTSRSYCVAVRSAKMPTYERNIKVQEDRISCGPSEPYRFLSSNTFIIETVTSHFDSALLLTADQRQTTLSARPVYAMVVFRIS